ncbi:MAG: hypothetical protein ACAH83_05380 [Alphaproteobacteria bacterium]
MAQADIPQNPIKDYNGGTASIEKQYGEISDIRSDLESLKTNVKSLSQHLQSDGKEKAEQVKSAISEGLDTLMIKGDKGLVALEESVKDNPRRSLVMAFLAGFAINILMRKG